MHKYCLEFILNIRDNITMQTLKDSIIELGENLEISQAQTTQNNAEKSNDFRIRIYTQDPTLVFDTCSQFGRLKSVKINEG